MPPQPPRGLRPCRRHGPRATRPSATASAAATRVRPRALGTPSAAAKASGSTPASSTAVGNRCTGAHELRQPATLRRGGLDADLLAHDRRGHSPERVQRTQHPHPGMPFDPGADLRVTRQLVVDLGRGRIQVQPAPHCGDPRREAPGTSAAGPSPMSTATDRSSKRASIALPSSVVVLTLFAPRST